MADHLIQQLKRHEGFSGKPYLCTAGKLTIGYGRNLDDTGVTESEAAELLRQDIARARHDVFVNIAFAQLLDDARLDVLINMCFNMGIYRLMSFKKMLTALEQRDYMQASAEMLDSRWAKQVGGRAVELAVQMQTGMYQ